MNTARWHPLIATSLLALAALFGNMASINLFFGVDLIFGSVAVILAALLLGIIPAVVVAVTGSIYTLLLWGHPYAMVIFTAEALVVAWLYRHKQLNPVIGDALFWLIAGVPLINQGATGELPEKAQQMADVAYRNTQHLSALVNDLLDMEAPDETLYANVDRQRLIQALSNRLSNAIRLSAAGARVAVDFKRDGKGLGLTIIRNLTTQMGGSAGFESIEGQGSTFWLWLPQQ